MKIRIITIVFTALMLSCRVSLFPQKKESVKELKTFALCQCVNDNYAKIDSAFYSSDVTNSYLFQYAPLSIKKYEKFNRFIDERTRNIYKELPYGSYDAPKSNMIFYFCMKFYESKELDRFIKKLLKEKDESVFE